MIDLLLILMMGAVALIIVSCIIQSVGSMCSHISDDLDRQLVSAEQRLLDDMIKDAYSQAIFKARVKRLIRSMFT